VRSHDRKRWTHELVLATFSSVASDDSRGRTGAAMWIRSFKCAGIEEDIILNVSATILCVSRAGFVLRDDAAYCSCCYGYSGHRHSSHLSLIIVAGFVEESAFLGEYHTVDQTGQSGTYNNTRQIHRCFY